MRFEHCATKNFQPVEGFVCDNVGFHTLQVVAGEGDVIAVGSVDFVKQVAKSFGIGVTAFGKNNRHTVHQVTQGIFICCSVHVVIGFNFV